MTLPQDNARDLSIHILENFVSYPQVARWVRKQFPGLPIRFVEETANKVMSEIKRKVLQGQVRCISEYLHTGQLSERARRGFFAFARTVCSLTAKSEYREWKKSRLFTNCDPGLLNRAYFEQDFESGSTDSSELELSFLYFKGYSFARANLSPLVLRALRLRLLGKNYLVIASLLGVDRNKASRLVRSAFSVVADFMATVFPASVIDTFRENGFKPAHSVPSSGDRSLQTQDFIGNGNDRFFLNLAEFIVDSLHTHAKKKRRDREKQVSSPFIERDDWGA